MIVEGDLRIQFTYRDGESFMEATIGDVNLGDAVEAHRGQRVRFSIEEIQPELREMDEGRAERALGQFGG